eukprot:TRINITY_DN5331_c0_g1_i2.p1 TRINITY_DN5331_c0_g1~~TRINITY_DN5331_c0_g1_i2.p1  ORF type:complete len:359 (-),score=22.15 TRINITY_DN5331_c0_g1_i2:5-1015(-)
MFGLLSTGITFDRKRYSSDIDLFEKSNNKPEQRQDEPTLSEQENDQEIVPTKLKRKQKLQEQVDSTQPDNVGISVFQSSSKKLKIEKVADTLVTDKHTKPKTSDEDNSWRKTHKIHVKGQHVPSPLQSFAQLSTKFELDQRILQNLDVFQYKEPTPIQMQAIPCIFAQRDMLATAPTGSGKTLAFVLPVLQQILLEKQEEDATQQSILRAIIVSPTKELSVQTQRVLNWTAEGTGIQSSFLNKSSMKEIKQADILLGTPFKLALYISKQQLDCSRVKFLILDEADKLFSEDVHKRKARNKRWKKKQREQQMDILLDRKSTRLNSSHQCASRMPSSA